MDIAQEMGPSERVALYCGPGFEGRSLRPQPHDRNLVEGWIGDDPPPPWTWSETRRKSPARTG